MVYIVQLHGWGLLGQSNCHYIYENSRQLSGILAVARGTMSSNVASKTCEPNITIMPVIVIVSRLSSESRY